MNSLLLQAGRQGRSHWGYYAAGAALTLLVQVVASVLLLGWQPFLKTAYASMAALLLPFGAGLVFLLFWVKYVHRRPLRTLITPYAQVRWGRIGASLLLWLLLTALAEAGLYAWKPELYAFASTREPLWPLWLTGLLLIPVQTSFEEIFFRGYLLQGIGCRWPWVGYVLTAVVFGLAHSFNTETIAAGMGMAMVYYVGVGLFLGGLALSDDMLELPLGIHAANNLYGILIMSYPDSSLPASSLFIMTRLNFPIMTAAWAVVAVLYTLLARRWPGLAANLQP